jgi:hypothetical protein
LLINGIHDMDCLRALGVEIDVQDDQLRERRRGGEAVDDRLLLRAGRAPGGGDIDQDRLTIRLRDLNACSVNGATVAACVEAVHSTLPVRRDRLKGYATA